MDIVNTANIEALADADLVALLNKAVEDYATAGLPESWLRPWSDREQTLESFHRDIERQSELVYWAHREGDLDKLLVFAACGINGTTCKFSDLNRIIDSLRNCGYETVFPMLDSVNMASAVRMRHIISFEKVDNDTGFMDQEGLEPVFDALLTACGVGSRDVADYLAPDVEHHSGLNLKGIALAAERRITDYQELISTVRMFLGSDESVLNEGLL